MSSNPNPFNRGSAENLRATLKLRPCRRTASPERGHGGTHVETCPGTPRPRANRRDRELGGGRSIAAAARAAPRWRWSLGPYRTDPGDQSRVLAVGEVPLVGARDPLQQVDLR